MKNLQTSRLPLQPYQLMKLFEDQLKDIFWTEKALTRAIPRMIKNATSKDLIETLTLHLEDTHEHVERLIKVFESIELKPISRKCESMESIIKEGETIMDTALPGAMCDIGIILAAQKVEHFEIATYGTLCAFAKTLGEDFAGALLQQTLDEEKQADIELTEIAESIYLKVVYEEEDESDIPTLRNTNSYKSKV